MSQKIEPYIPIYSRPPNKLVEMKEVRFDDGAGHSGIKTIAVFLNKKGQHEEIVARVKWDDM